MSNGARRKVEILKVPLGIKQGGINSPDFFGIYIDDLSKLLRNRQIGCHLFKLFVALLLFADDLCLMAPSRAALQRMINECAEYCNKFGLTFNAKKSKILIFCKKTINKEQIKPVYLNGDKVDIVDSVKYLGATIVSNKGLSFSSSKDLLSFYRASNAILRATNRPSEEVLLHLLYSNCIPILTYASAVKEYPARQINILIRIR